MNFLDLFSDEAKTVFDAAASLISADSLNYEYDRAIVELSCTLLGISTDNRDIVSDIIHNLAD